MKKLLVLLFVPVLAFSQVQKKLDGMQRVTSDSVKVGSTGTGTITKNGTYGLFNRGASGMSYDWAVIGANDESFLFGVVHNGLWVQFNKPILASSSIVGDSAGFTHGTIDTLKANDITLAGGGNISATTIGVGTATATKFHVSPGDTSSTVAGDIMYNIAGGKFFYEDGTGIHEFGTGGGGAGTITGATNLGGTGLYTSASGANLQFKGLSAGTDVTVTSGSYYLTIGLGTNVPRLNASNNFTNYVTSTFSSFSAPVMLGVNTSIGTGVQGQSAGGKGVYGVSTSGQGGYFTATTGTAGYFSSTSGKGIEIHADGGSNAIEAYNGASTLFTVADDGQVTVGGGLNFTSITNGLLYAASNSVTSLAHGTNGKYLQMVAGLPAWSSWALLSASDIDTATNGWHDGYGLIVDTATGKLTTTSMVEDSSTAGHLVKKNAAGTALVDDDERTFFTTGLMDSVKATDTLGIIRPYPGKTIQRIIVDAARNCAFTVRLEIVDSLYQTSGVTLLDSITVTTQTHTHTTAGAGGTFIVASGKLIRAVFPSVAVMPKHLLITATGKD